MSGTNIEKATPLISSLDDRLISVPLNNIISQSIDEVYLPRVKHIKTANYPENFIPAQIFYKPITRFWLHE